MAISNPTPRPDRTAPPRLSSYDEARATYVVEVPERFNPVVDIIERWAAEDPGAPALVSIGGDGEVAASHTAAELSQEACAAARALHALGVRPGDRVFVMLPRVPAWYQAVLGAIRLGAVPMPAPNQLTSRDIGYRLAAGRPTVAITDASGAAKLDGVQQLPAELHHRVLWDPSGAGRPGWLDLDKLLADDRGVELPEQPTHRDDPLLVFFTSGTVSYPKMVLHTQGYALGHVATARFWHDLRPGDLHWTVSDSGWAKAAWGGLFGQWHERACVVQAALARPDAAAVLGVLERHGITSFCAPPTLYRMLVLEDLAARDLSRLRHCTSAGEPLNPQVIRAWRDGTDGLTVYDGYGQTETTALVANYRAMEVRAGSMGRPVPGYEVEVVDDEGVPAPDGEVGHVAVRTAPERPVGLFSCYQDDPDATAERFRGEWYYTGDKAARDPDGYFWFEGREDDVITSSAYRIGPFEVESALVEHPAVAEAGVVGRPDPERTEIVCAFVLLAPGNEPTVELASDIQAHVRSVTAPYKYPREIYYVNELPKTVSGKIRRTDLRRWLAEGLPADVVPGLERPGRA